MLSCMHQRSQTVTAFKRGKTSAQGQQVAAKTSRQSCISTLHSQRKEHASAAGKQGAALHHELYPSHKTQPCRTLVLLREGSLTYYAHSFSC